MPVIGVLALQGDFKEHLSLLKAHFVPAIEVRCLEDLEKCSALIIPGGESTAMAKLLGSTGLGAVIKKRVANGMPFYGACAGAILAAKKVVGEKRFKPLGLIGIEISRNDYGRQVDSFEAELEIKSLCSIRVGAGGNGNTGKTIFDEQEKVNGIFIRAPVIRKVGRKVEVLARLGNKPVLARQGNVLVGTFHPETEKNFFCHKLLLEMVQ